MRRVQPIKGASVPRTVASSAPGMLSKLPALIEHLCVIKYDDDERRTPGAIRVWTDGPEWCVRVSDPDSCSSFVVRADTLSSALLLAEKLLTADVCPWAPDDFLERMAARKKKK